MNYNLTVARNRMPMFVWRDDMAAAEEFELQFALHVSDVLPEISFHYQNNEPGQIDVVMFLARSGYGLPQDLP